METDQSDAIVAAGSDPAMNLLFFEIAASVMASRWLRFLFGWMLPLQQCMLVEMEFLPITFLFSVEVMTCKNTASVQIPWRDKTLADSSTLSYLERRRRRKQVVMMMMMMMMMKMIEMINLRLSFSMVSPPMPGIENEHIHVFPCIPTLDGVQLQDSTNWLLNNIHQIQCVIQHQIHFIFLNHHHKDWHITSQVVKGTLVVYV